jgi:alkane 1-monooxygenase
MKWVDLKYLFAYVGPISAYLAVWVSGIWSYSAVILAFVLIPLSELLMAGKNDDDTADQSENRRNHPFFDWLLYLNLPMLYGLIVGFLWRVTATPLSLFEIIGMTLGVGIFVGATGINVAHELGHRPGIVAQWMSKALLLTAMYQHFYIEHNHGHHRYVATEDDPATARYGESLYKFWLRSAVGSLLSAWNIEVARLAKMNLVWFSFQNQMLIFAFTQGLYFATIGFIFGTAGILYALIIAIIGFLLLESINYIEHYALRRSKNESGIYEKVSVKHSWNSNHDTGRIFLYELSRHADHHYKASKKYQLLQHIEESPQLPTGYPGSIILAMLPPLWFAIMNDRVPAEMKCT